MIGKSNNLIVFESYKTKGPKQASQNLIRTHTPKRGEPSFGKQLHYLGTVNCDETEERQLLTL